MSALLAKPIEVVSALIFNEQLEMLMTRRKIESLRPDVWENPGGKVDSGDSNPISALVREMQEELGVWVRVRELVSVARFDLERTYFMSLYLCVIDTGEPRPLESQAIMYFDPEDAIMNYPCAPGTYVFYRDIIRCRSNILSRQALLS